MLQLEQSVLLLIRLKEHRFFEILSLPGKSRETITDEGGIRILLDRAGKRLSRKLEVSIRIRELSDEYVVIRGRLGSLDP